MLQPNQEILISAHSKFFMELRVLHPESVGSIAVANRGIAKELQVNNSAPMRCALRATDVDGIFGLHAQNIERLMPAPGLAKKSSPSVPA